MPELPEVEVIRRQLDPLLRGERIRDVWTHPSTKFSEAQASAGQTIQRVDRRGKYLLFGLDRDRELVAHLGMTGRFVPDAPVDQTQHKHCRAYWVLADGSRLLFLDIRRFGRLCYTIAGDYKRLPTLDRCGPEPFDPTFDAEQFWRFLQKSRQPIKTQLLSQRPIAGVGNIYADEALWLAGLDPRKTTISRKNAEILFTSLRYVLAQGISNGGTTLRDYRNAIGEPGANQDELNVYGRGDKPCPRCGANLRSLSLRGRATTWCGSCQKK